MRKIISLLLAVVMMAGLTACGQKQRKIEVVKNEQPVNAEKLDIPAELQGYNHVYLKSFDGQYAVFTVERENQIGDYKYAQETGKIVVYDVINKFVAHMVILNYPDGRVRDAVKVGNNLYFTVCYNLENKEDIYINNGLEIKLLNQFSLTTTADFSRFMKTEDDLFLIRNNGSFDNYDYEFFKVSEADFNSLGRFQQINKGFVEFIGYEDNKVIVSETEINDDGYIYINRWTGDNKERVFRLADEHAHSFRQLENMFIHPVDSIDNNGRYKMMAVTDMNTKNVTELGMMQGGFFDTYENKGLMYTYGESREQILLYEGKDNILEITPLDIDVAGKNSHVYHMTADNALISIGSVGESGLELYLIEY